MTVLGKRVEIDLDNIVLATDFSSTAEKASLYAQSLARRYRAMVHLVHIVDISQLAKAPDAGISIDICRKFGEDRLQEMKASFLSEKIHAASSLREGIDPAEEIVQISKESKADLIVVGTEGRTGLSRLALGSIARRIIHHAACPVLTVGPAVEPPPQVLTFRRIVYATDFSPEAVKAAVYAFSFAQDGGAHIYLCHVLPETDHMHRVEDKKLTEEFMHSLETMIPDISREWCEPECVLEYGRAADGILLLAQRVDADLIVLGTRSVSHWFDNFKAGIAFEVIRSSKCPVLTIRG